MNFSEGPCNASPACCKEDCYAYRGMFNRTRSGIICQRWDSQKPHEHNYTKENFPEAGLDENYCRNPSGAHKAWCYTMDTSRRWKYCYSPICGNYYFIGPCCRKKRCIDFRGKYAKTISGRTCKPWTETRFHPDQYPGFGLEANYCRNPSKHERTWCYTTDPKKSWEECDVDVCVDA